ncbi:NAD(P)-binding protein [Mycena sanguinolenta]|uniref:NAD(P)-binding protein n=1 Tax=Mycena sanguinolenta TaxID=230812 RepID=A0A8H7CRU7_9AGAR|nr:NAD(P)-binding protein [Mycena sanguinolenta]
MSVKTVYLSAFLFTKCPLRFLTGEISFWCESWHWIWTCCRPRGAPQHCCLRWRKRPSLKDLRAKYSNVYLVKLTSGDKADNEAAIAEIQKTAGRLDVVIANAGISKHHGPLATASLSEFRDHFEVNTIGLIVLFQAAHELLLASLTGAPTFAYISTGAASISRYYHLSVGPYAASKAAANFLVKVLDAEHPSLIVMAIHPGWVATDSGNVGAKNNGLAQAPVTVEDSVAGILTRIDGATKEKSSGRFWNFKAVKDGMLWDLETEEVPW